jgi:hypothetical protein
LSTTERTNFFSFEIKLEMGRARARGSIAALTFSRFSVETKEAANRDGL